MIRAGHWKRARAVLETQIKTSPQDAQTCYLLAQVRRVFKQLDQALPLAQQAVALDSKNSNFHLELARVYGEMAEKASFLSAGALAVKFRKEVEVALRLDPRSTDALDTMMQFKYQAPVVLGGNKVEAHALADRIASVNSCQGYLAHAELAKMENDPSQEEANYLKAAQSNPTCYGALTAIADYYSQPAIAKYNEASKYAEHAVREDSKRVGGYWILARAYAHQQRWNELERVLAESAKAVPDDLRPYYEAAQGLLDVGADFPRAENYAKTYLSQEPEGEEPDVADAHRLLGLVLAKEGRNTQARLEIKIALLDRPSFKAAKRDLKSIEN